MQLIVLARNLADQRSVEAGKTWSWIVTSLVVAGCVEKGLARQSHMKLCGHSEGLVQVASCILAAA